MGWELVGRQGPRPLCCGCSVLTRRVLSRALRISSLEGQEPGLPALGVMLLGRALQVSLKAQNSEQEGGGPEQHWGGGHAARSLPLPG